MQLTAIFSPVTISKYWLRNKNGNDKKEKAPINGANSINQFYYKSKDTICQGGKMLYRIDDPRLFVALDDYITDCEPKRDIDYEKLLDFADEKYHREKEDEGNE